MTVPVAFTFQQFQDWAVIWLPIIFMGLIAVVLIAAMFIHGIRPGPLLMTESPEVLYQIVAILLFFTVLFVYPFIWLLNAASNGLLRLTGVKISPDAHGGLPLLAPYLTTLVATFVGLAHYEWTHLLVHARYRPTSRRQCPAARPQ